VRDRTVEEGSAVAASCRGVASGPSRRCRQEHSRDRTPYGAEFPRAKEAPSTMRPALPRPRAPSLSVFCSYRSGANHSPRHHRPEMTSSGALFPTRLNAAAPRSRLATWQLPT
jgi:hypothetical protein